MKTTRTIIHSDNHTDIETYLQDADGVWVWAVTQCGLKQEKQAMTEKMTQLEYAKSYAPQSRIPESFLTMGDVVELLERIEELKAEVKNLDEGAKLMHSLATGGESKLLKDWDLLESTPDPLARARSIALPNGQLRSYATYKNTGKAQPLNAADVDGERLGE